MTGLGKALFCVLLFGVISWSSIVVLDLQSRGIWCQRTPTQLGRQCSTLVDVVQRLNQHNVTNWLCYGSALAVIRAEATGTPATPIPWEADDDLCVFEHDAHRIEAVLSSFSSTSTVSTFPSLPVLRTEVLIGNIVRYRVTRVDQLAGEEWGIDIYSHKEQTYYESQIMIQNVAANRERTHRDFPKHIIQPLSRQQQYCGASIFSLPHNRVEYVTHLFGTTWKTPLASFTGSNGYRRLTCLLSAPFSRTSLPKLRATSDLEHGREKSEA